MPAFRHLPCDRQAEERVQLGRGQEITTAAGTAMRGHVVPMIGLVERELHEPRERDGPRLEDFLPDRGNQVRISLATLTSLASRTGLVLV